MTLTIALLLAGCTIPGTPPPSPPPACDAVTSLFLVADILGDTAHPCHSWIDSVHGRVARSSNASAVVWSRRTTHGTGILVSAVHTLGVGWFEPDGREVPESLSDPTLQNGVPRIFLVPPEGGPPDTLATPMFEFYHPRIPAEENANRFRNILPRRDFFLAAVDSQKITVDLIVGAVEPLRDETVQVYDPDGLTTEAPTYAPGVAGALVMVMGYPQAAPFGSRQSACVGRVLADTEAVAAIERLADAGDEEGDIPYEPEVEMLIEGDALGGMSGGGVFDGDGRLIAILVRASNDLNGVQYIRAVRMTHIVSEVYGAFDALPLEERNAVAPYLEPASP